MMVTKHEQIIRHIISLEIGNKISVRQIAKELNVSDGTAYRAIKEAENQGLVTTIERVGTIRIERKAKADFDRLTFAEIINIIDGQVLGGRDGLHKTLNKFLIGAMEIDPMTYYIEPDSLLIVGNRESVHELAIEKGAAVLITGGFDTSDHVKELANEKDLPVISTSYDTYTVAAMINRAIYDQLIKKDIVAVDDIQTPLEKIYYLNLNDKASDWYKLNDQSKHTRFPVINDKHQVSGMVTAKDIVGKDSELLIEKFMTKNPFVVKSQTSLAYVAHMMVWEGIEVVPIVDELGKIKGLVSRQDVLKALQQIQRQPQVGETIDDLVASNLRAQDDDKTVFETEVIPQMTNQLGTLSNGVFVSLITEASSRLLLHLQKGNLAVENITVFFIKPVQLDNKLIIKPKLLEVGRIYAKIDVEIYHDEKVVGKGLLMAQLIERK